jgi:hypothetical protein
MRMKIKISEQQKNGEWKIIEKTLPYSKQSYKEYCKMPELISIEIIN